MTQRKGGLGRGLAALIPTGPDEGPRLGAAAADVVLGEASVQRRAADARCGACEDGDYFGGKVCWDARVGGVDLGEGNHFMGW